MHLVSWNVNGIRACVRKGGDQWLGQCGADVICLQETRAFPEQVDLELPGYESYWNPAEKAGYSGVAIYARREPLEVTAGLGIVELDTEGRVLTAEFDDIFAVTVYTPNSQKELRRLEYRQHRWDPSFLEHMRELATRKPVVFCGDLNVAHKEIDLANPRSNRRNAGFTDEERSAFDAMLDGGFVDTFREFETGGGHYSWWSNRPGVRERNVGWRIDYVLVSEELRPRLEAAAIHPEVMGSDHCPVSIRLR